MAMPPSNPSAATTARLIEPLNATPPTPEFTKRKNHTSQSRRPQRLKHQTKKTGEQGNAAPQHSHNAKENQKKIRSGGTHEL